jgi:hypothetical protein
MTLFQKKIQTTTHKFASFFVVLFFKGGPQLHLWSFLKGMQICNQIDDAIAISCNVAGGLWEPSH